MTQIPYIMRKDFAEQIADFLSSHMNADDEASHAVAAALYALANGDGPIILDEETVKESAL